MNIEPSQLLRLIAEKRSLRKRLANALWGNRQLARKLRVAEQSCQQQEKEVGSLRLALRETQRLLSEAPTPEHMAGIEHHMSRLSRDNIDMRRQLYRLNGCERVMDEQSEVIQGLLAANAELLAQLRELRDQPLPEWAREIQETMKQYEGEL